ncbi:PqqD family peptide modification chaperone [candidate division CSSED10-310 bacterium]|uniref:PqqD family peptide modification chaperone n=1 Tax=candidate division CSSED10-310 bacterium TaxID=2855610 RepID=A0ABV6YUB2_UNCC1
MDTTHYCTWAKTLNSPELEILLESARRVGIHIDVMPCNGFLDKPIALRKYISKLPKTDIVICTDGYDVVYTQPEEKILSRFSDFDAPLVFGGEKNCYHHFPGAKVYFEQTGKSGLYQYLNSGLIIGYVGPIQLMLENIMGLETDLKKEFWKTPGTVGFFNDQTIYGRYACEHPGKILVDTNADLFWTMADEKYDLDRYADISSNGIRNLESSSLPCLVHVSHLRKFYLVYLEIAWKMGIQLTSVKLNHNMLLGLLEGKAEKANEERLIIDSEFRKFLEDMHYGKPVRKQTSESVAIIFIGTGRYIKYFKRYYETSRKLFLPITPKTYFVFTDDVNSAALPGKDDIVPVETAAEEWPFSTLFRFRYINRIHKQLAEHSHTVYIDADMYLCSFVPEEEFFGHDKPLFGVQHPGNYMRGHAPFERNPGSRAYVSNADNQSTYWQGCFWGGRTKEVLMLSQTLAERIDNDLSRNIIARWHDESHLNKYFIENHAIVQTYHPGYAYPEMLEGKLPVEKKIVHIMKDHQNLRTNHLKKTEAKIEPDQVVDGAPRNLNDATVLVRKDGYHLANTPSALVIHNSNNVVIARINETGAIIWRLCEGDHSVGDLINIFSSVFSVSPEVVKQDVYPLLSDFIERGLVRQKITTARTGNARDTSGIRFYSFANNINAENLSVLKESAATHNSEITFLGNGLTRFSTTMKLNLLYEQLCNLDDNEIVCAVDGFDVFFCAGGEEIKQRFISFNCDCVISAERAYAHQYRKYKKFYDNVQSRSPYRYINTGSFIGYAGALKKICATTLSMRVQQKVFTAKNIHKIKRYSEKVAKALRYKNFDKNFIYSCVYYTDQQHIGKYVARNPENLKIALDYDTKLFWCCAWEWKDINAHFRVEGNRIVNNHTANSPVIIHVPGWREHGKVFSALFGIQQSLNRATSI